MQAAILQLLLQQKRAESSIWQVSTIYIYPINDQTKETEPSDSVMQITHKTN
jgi:hypothetical protein